jgi:hypothetical protein
MGITLDQRPAGLDVRLHLKMAGLEATEAAYGLLEGGGKLFAGHR